MALLETLTKAELLAVRCATAKGRLDAHAAEYSALLTEVGEAKGRIELAPEVEAFVSGWQSRLHARNVGVMEQLLTALLRDVIPGDKQATFTLSTERGAPALDIELTTDGEREDILDGHGGAVTNVVSAGLRFIALSRSGARKFIALDEADCWLPEGRIGLFSNVLARVSETLEVQTLLISHHDLSHFEDVAYPVKLNLDPAYGVSATPARELPAWTPGQAGLRWIRLINFRKHTDTTLPLAPGITALVGDTDVGKSTVISALRAIAYGESSDTVIQHKMPYAEVQVRLEDDLTLAWRRVRKGSPKTRYTLFDATGAVVREENMARGAPGWVSELLGIVKSDELDIQVGSQKKPIFLLDETASRRAALLSVGRESGYLSAMLEAHRDEVKLDRERVRRGEERLGSLGAELKGSAGLGELIEVAGRTVETLKSLLGRETARNTLMGLMAQVTALQVKLDLMAKTLSGLVVPDVPASLNPSGELAAAIEKLRLLSAKSACSPEAICIPVLPELHPLGALLEKGKVLARLERAVSLASTLVPACPLPALRDTAALQDRLARAEVLEQHKAKLALQIEAEKLALNAAHADLDLALQAMGDVCPVCNHAISSKDLLHDYAA
jgi:hypothetical protein